MKVEPESLITCKHRLKRCCNQSTACCCDFIIAFCFSTRSMLIIPCCCCCCVVKISRFCCCCCCCYGCTTTKTRLQAAKLQGNRPPMVKSHSTQRAVNRREHCQICCSEPHTSLTRRQHILPASNSTPTGFCSCTNARFPKASASFVSTLHSHL